MSGVGDVQTGLTTRLAWPLALVSTGAMLVVLQPAGALRVLIAGAMVVTGVTAWLSARLTRALYSRAAASIAVLAACLAVTLALLPSAPDSNRAVVATARDRCKGQTSHPEALGVEGCVMFRTTLGDGQLSRRAATTPARAVEVILSYWNSSSVRQEDVVLRVALPEGIEYVAGSSVLANGNSPYSKSISDNVPNRGINIGSYLPGTNAWIRFYVLVDKVETWPCGNSNRSLTLAIETNAGSSQDEATIEVARRC